MMIRMRVYLAVLVLAVLVHAQNEDQEEDQQPKTPEVQDYSWHLFWNKRFVMETVTRLAIIRQPPAASPLVAAIQTRHFLLVAKSDRLLLEPLDRERYNPLGLYQPKVIYRVGDDSSTSGGQITAIALDPIGRRIYLATTGGATIEWMDLCPGIRHVAAAPVVRLNETFIQHLAVDRRRQLLVWCARTTLTVAILPDHDTVSSSTVLLELESEPDAMTFDVEHGNVYWIHNGTLRQVSYAIDPMQQRQSPPEVRVYTGQPFIGVNQIRIIGRHRLYYVQMNRMLFRSDLDPHHYQEKPTLVMQTNSSFWFITTFDAFELDENSNEPPFELSNDPIFECERFEHLHQEKSDIILDHKTIWDHLTSMDIFESPRDIAAIIVGAIVALAVVLLASAIQALIWYVCCGRRQRSNPLPEPEIYENPTIGKRHSYHQSRRDLPVPGNGNTRLRF